jgi:predicted double-glycine peptidase
MLYVQLVGFPILAAGAIWTGWWGSRRRFWWLGVAGAMTVIGLVILGHRVARLHFAAPISWAVDADWNPFLMTVAIGVVFATLIPKLPERRTWVSVAVIMEVLLVYYGLMPAVAPLAVRGSLAPHRNLMDRNGICLQRYSYTCGPAATVTCLERLGIMDEEVGIALEARSSPIFGTDGHLLVAAIERRHPGVEARYRYAETLEELRVPAVAEMVIPMFSGHYVAVLAIKGESVVIGDPLGGLREMPREVFLGYWQHGVVEIGGKSGG